MAALRTNVSVLEKAQLRQRCAASLFHSDSMPCALYCCAAASLVKPSLLQKVLLCVGPEVRSCQAEHENCGELLQNA